MLLFRPLPLLMVLLLPACKETPICEGVETQLCYCPTGDAGVQICDIDGDSWEPCECIPEDSETGDGSGSGSGSGDGSGAPVPVRVHSHDMTDDALGIGAGDLESALRLVAAEGRGAVILMEPDRQGESEGGRGAHLRRYGIGAQILLDLGIRRMVLLTDRPKTPAGLDGFGLEITGFRPLHPAE